MTINKDNVFTDESFAPIATVPSTLTADQLVELRNAQQDEGAVHTQGTAYQRSRALAYRNRHRFVASVSPAALAYHVEKVMDYKVDGLRLTGIDREYQIAAMGILQLDVLRTVTKSDKADQNNRISDLRRALESLNHFASAIEDMTDDEFVTWFAGMGGLDGIHREFRAANPVEVEPVRDDKKIRTAIDAMIANSNAVEVDNPGLATGIRLFVARGEGGKLRMVPLDASADFIASLSDRAPDPMTNTPSRVMLFRELLLTASRIVPDVMSDVPKRPLRPGEQVSATTEMLPANHIVYVRGGVFSIAGSRVEDTIVVEVEPRDEKLARYLTGEGFIDTMTRKNMLSRLEPTSTAAGYTGVTVADAESKNGPEVRVSFERGENKVDGQLIVKTINRMGGLHTWRVKAFKSTASATIDAAGRKAFNERFLAHVIKARDDHAVSITIDAKGLGFQLGSAKTAAVSVIDTSGEETVRVAKADFLRAVNGLLALPLNDAIVWSVDPRGLLRIEAYTASATYRVFVQLLRKEKDPKAQVRERAMLERIARPDAAAVAA